MTHVPALTRRSALAGGAAALALLPVVARADTVLDATTMGVVGGSADDQSAVLQAALEQASASGQALRLPPGIIEVQGLDLPGNMVLEGVPGSTEIHQIGDGAGISVTDRGSLVLRDIGFSGGSSALTIGASDDIRIERCSFRNSGVGLAISDASVTIRDCRFTEMGDAAIHAMDSRGLTIEANRIDYCGNAGIRIWRSESGPDGSIVSGNSISNVDWREGGNGQNGNGINVFRADNVIVANNHLADCAFTAVRLNATKNCQVIGNSCLRSGEVAIFSEFEFSGSVIANNVIDGAATGISITNLDVGGALAVCLGNLVRNITPMSAVNPDTIPLGIYAEADTAITGNTVENVPGVGIGAGYGPYLRNVAISGNVVSKSLIGIGVSVVDGAGTVTLAGNSVSEAQHDIVGLAWKDIVEPDLVANAAQYPNVRLAP
ncbi:TIGR03808 family TAT-translocated repetitive protein [Devosia sp. FKR38]|uniref:TIGR03808 family TAT-translocated repetitive protein n=1 Tax=Devosia sp. FKR38 TaxID=2562312 RepID=UPI00148501F5|nr:TIGR03808 family TAT-translocated repetitive protein [Devosia sp. FKR38]